MTQETYPDALPIEPSPRILQMLGHVNFDGWQCIAELVDNGIDAFLRDQESDLTHQHRIVDVALPNAAALNDGTATVVVSDNAAGMTLAEMQDAVRAGYSGNDPVGRLGLFGMGFNVSTARLGRVTEIMSHRDGDIEWVGLRIDVDEMVRNRTWNAPVIREALSTADGPSGTRVRISRIPREGVVRGMIWGAGKPALLRRLSRLYHVAMERHVIQILVNRSSLIPWRLCLWGEERSVPSQAWGRVPALFDIDETLPTLPYCMNCWEWGVPDQSTCYLCAGDMTARERRIKGVLGIQRSFSIAWGEGELSHYGVDLIRNGRVIEAFDKDLFDWADPSDPARRELDYPVDGTFLGGRIVGELEIDFVPLRSYHKDSFEKSDPAWIDVRNRLRGEAPLRPDIARRYGYERPDTVLARLFDGYRKTSPAGERYLITGHPPGRKKNPRDPMHTAPELEEWIEGFENDDEAYRADTKWWQAVQWAEQADLDTESSEVGDGGAPSPFDQPTVAEEPDEDEESSAGEPDVAPETTPDPSLSVLVNTADIVRNAPSSLTVRAARVTRGSLPNAYSVAVDPRGHEIDFTWDPRHPDFRQGIIHPMDCLITELAVQVMYRAQVTQREYPVSYIERVITQRAFPARDAGVDSVAQRATGILQDMKSFLEAALADKDALAIELEPLELSTLERAAAPAGIAGAEVPELIRSGAFIRFMPLKFMPRCALLFPEILMNEDGFFALDYEGYETEELRAELRQALYVNLADIVWLVEERANLGRTLTDLARLQLQKSTTALQILELQRRA